jgi:cytokinesis protein
MTSHIREHLPEKVKDSLHNLRQSYYGTADLMTGPGGEFSLPRPADPQEIEYMFERVRQERDMGDAVNMSLEQKWGIVHAHERDRWLQQRRKDAQLRRSAAMGNGQSVIAKDTPEWYMKKFMDQTITAKHVGSLTVSLRTLPIELVHSRMSPLYR